MSDYQGNIIIKNPATPTGPAQNGSAPGIWKLSEALAFKRQGIWPTQGVSAGDPYFSYVSMLLSTTSLGNANNSLFVDSSGTFTPLSRTGNATQGSATPYSANWSNYFDGSSTLTFSTISLTGDFTIEAWVYYTSTSGNPTLLGANPPNDQSLRRLSGKHYFYRQGASITGTIDIPSNQWVHLAATRSGSTVRIFTNGVLDGSASISGTFSLFCLGGVDTSTDRLTGYASNVRVVNGTALYTATFTPPTQPLTAVSGTVLLTCQSNRFRDASASPYTLTVNGSPRVTNFAPFSPGSAIAYNQSDITNWSGYFDGTSDWLATPSNGVFGFGTGDFTIECWMYPTSTKANMRLWEFSSNSDNVDISNAGTTGAISYYNGSTSTVSSGGVVVFNAWNHVACVRSSGTVRIYLNGVLQVTQASTPNSSARILYIGGQGSDWFQGAISNFRVVKGTAVYTGAFTPPTAPLTAISGTSLLTLQNAAFTDNSANSFVLTPNGNVTVTGNSPFNTVGYWSNYFDGSGDYLTASSANFAFGTGAWTVEFWIYPLAYGGSIAGAQLFGTVNGATSGYSIQLGQDVNSFRITSNATGSWADNLSVGTGNGPPLNAWTHMAVVRSGANLSIYKNGTRVATTASATSWNFSGTTGVIGRFNDGPNVRDLNGYLSNLRVANSAIYDPTQSTLTVPTTPPTAVSGTQLLTCQNGRFIDNSANALSVTVNGNPSVQSFDPFYTSTIASNGGSMYFDGTGDFLSVPYNAALDFGTSDFTVEMWVYFPATVSANNALIAGWTTGEPVSGWVVGADGTNFYFVSAVSASYSTQAVNTAARTPGSWHHVAVVRSSGNVTVYVNGVGGTAVSNTQNITTAATGLNIGRSPYTANPSPFTGYISNLRIVKGTAVYTGNFTPPTAPVTPTAATTLLVNGMNAGIYDATAINDMETVGNAQVRFPSPFAPANYWAGSFDGNGDYLSVPNSTSLDFGTGDFTLEGWVYFTSLSGRNSLFGGNATGGFDIQLSTPTNLISLGRSDVAYDFNSSFTFATGQWYHVAITRASGTARCFVNGALINSASNSVSYNQAGGQTLIGASVSSGSVFHAINGQISNVRVVKGTAVYTSAFTPSTTPLTAISGTSLLTCQNKTFIDNSTNAFTITAVGNATAGAIGPFTATGGTSVYFDGSGDYLVAANQPTLNFGTGDFTIEMWINFSSFTGSIGVLGKRASEMNYSPIVLEGSGNTLRLYMSTTGSSWQVSALSTGTLSTGVWYHYAVSRSGSTVYAFVNGISVGSTGTASGPLMTNTDPMTIGQASVSISASVPLNGYIDDFRITNGYARYTTNFTPPTQPFVTY